MDNFENNNVKEEEAQDYLKEIQTGIKDIINGFKISIEKLYIEKRRKRKLQMTSFLLS